MKDEKETSRPKIILGGALILGPLLTMDLWMDMLPNMDSPAWPVYLALSIFGIFLLGLIGLCLIADSVEPKADK